MARGRIDAYYRPNTLMENKMVLCELRSRGKIEHKTSHELNKLFAKLNCDSAPKHWKNGKAALGSKQEKVTAVPPYGPVEGFPPGSWWGIRMDCSRDRVHGPFNADIQDGPVGAVSLCTSHLNSHNDEDLGDSLTFTGGIYEAGVQTDDPLIRSYQSQVPLRVIRSYNLNNDFAPKTGYRYDGLYTVATYWIGVSSDTEKRYKFALTRVKNQDPPVWQGTIGTICKTAANAKKNNVHQTRCNTDRFSTSLCNETHLSANEQDNANRFVKTTNTNVVDKITPECKKNTHDSAIVTRCISVKKTECPSSSVSYSESPVQNAQRILEKSSKSTPCKLQNTNISIRTDLYDSSHNVQYDTKKIIPMTFCRTFGSTRNTRVVNHSHVGTLNLNSCGPCPRDGEQESLIQLRSGISKISSTQSPCSESNRSTDRSNTPKINFVDSLGELRSHFDTIETRISNASDDGNLDCPKGKRLEEEEQRGKENSTAKMFNEIDNKATDNVCPITRTSSKKNAENLVTDETREEILMEQRKAVDSLTPDQMLKYIVKQKYHPTAKLLIDSVIGLATGESKILRTYESLLSRNKSWSCNKKLRDENDDSTTNGKVEKPLDRRQSTSDRSMKKERNVGKSAKQKRGIKERIFSMRLRRTRVSKRLLGSEKKSSAKNVIDNSSKIRRKSKDTEKGQQAFSKSTTLNSKKCAKKRRSELANLAIDANIGPKIRGPRNRRLRGGSHIFSKRRHDIDISSCCGSGNRSEIGKRGKKGNSRVELTSKRSRRLTPVAKTIIPQSRFTEHKKRIQKTETTNVEQKIESSPNNNRRNLVVSSRKVEKRKGSRSQSLNDKNKRLCRNEEKNASTIQRLITMVDAATQCSNQRDASTSIDPDVEQSSANEEHENSVKIEWIDLDEVKSEQCESDEEEFVLELASERHRNSGLEVAHEDHEITRKTCETLTIRPQVEKPQITNVTERLSAFVPVNISDSDYRIARLRSIGFRPIEPACIQHEKDQCTANCASGSSKEPSESTVINRVADEQYNKYTSEETTVVGYMDQELRYQDVEEDVVTFIRHSKNLQFNEKIGNKVTARIRNKKLNVNEGVKVETVKTRRASKSLEDDSEIPWHGWRKYVKNKQAHWVGW